MQAICLLLGVPEADRHLLFDAVEHIFDIPDESDFLSMTPEREAAVGLLYEYGAALIAEKRAVPVPGHAVDGHPRRAPRCRPAPVERRRALRLLLPAVLRWCRDHSQCRCRRHARLLRLARAARTSALRSGGHGHRGGGDPALDDAIALEAQDGHHDLHTRRGAHRCRPEGGRLGRLGEPRSAAFRRARHLPPVSATPTHTCPLVTAPTSASARTSPAWRSAWRSKRCSVPSTSFTLAAPAEWTRSNRHTGIRHLPLRLRKGDHNIRAGHRRVTLAHTKAGCTPA